MPFQPGTPITGAQATANYIAGAQAKAQKWVTNTLKPRRLFTDAAIAQSGTWLQKINQVGTAGFEAGMRRAANNLDKIAANIQTNGAGSYSTGVQAKSYKYAAQADANIQNTQQIVSQLPPRGDLEANIARAAAFQRAKAATRGQFRG